MAAFSTQSINYFENRADGGFAWNVAYDLSFLNSVVQIALRVKLVGDNPGQVATIWDNGIETYWNHKVFFADSERLYEVKLAFDFVASGQHQTVTVHNATGRADMLNWYLTPEGWGTAYLDEIAAHEVGHMLGNFDEYAGGATHNGFTRTGTLMSDLTLAGFQDYFWTAEFYTEHYGSMTLSTILAITGAEDDNILTGTSGMDGFYGFGGNDRISGLGGNDHLDGGTGNDTLIGGAGADYMNGGTGLDTVDYSSSSDSWDVNLSTGVAQNVTSGGSDTLFSIENADLGSGNDNIRLFTGDFNSLIDGGLGSDTAYVTYTYGSGYTVSGSTTSLVMVGAAGTDTFDSIELFHFQNGVTKTAAELLGNSQLPDLTASNVSVTDTTPNPGQSITVNFQINNIGPGAAGEFDAGVYISTDATVTTADTLIHFQSFASGLAGNSSTFGSIAGTLSNGLTPGATYWIGVIADDLNEVTNEISESNNVAAIAITVESGQPGSSNDTLRGGAGDEVLDGGGGIDTVDYSTTTQGITVNLLASSNHAAGPEIGTDQLLSIENVTGGSGPDSIVGSPQTNTLVGGPGNDWLYGGGDTDTFHGGTGNDALNGGIGADTMYGEADDDGLFGGEGNDTLSGGSGTDYLVGGNGNNSLYGDADNDSLNDGDGNGYLFGGSGDDGMFGGGGADQFFSGSGSDWMVGGNGGDTFVFTPGDGADTIVDFNVLEDHINLGLIPGIDTFANVQARMSFNGFNTIIDLGGNGDRITIKDVRPETLQSDDFYI